MPDYGTEALTLLYRGDHMGLRSGGLGFGKKTSAGDWREVWFIHGGYLYEVTTYKELDTWLGSIMQTRKFI